MFPAVFTSVITSNVTNKVHVTIIICSTKILKFLLLFSAILLDCKTKSAIQKQKNVYTRLVTIVLLRRGRRQLRWVPDMHRNIRIRPRYRCPGDPGIPRSTASHPWIMARLLLSGNAGLPLHAGSVVLAIEIVWSVQDVIDRGCHRSSCSSWPRRRPSCGSAPRRLSGRHSPAAGPDA